MEKDLTLNNNSIKIDSKILIGKLKLKKIELAKISIYKNYDNIESNPKIFISHSSKNKKYGDALRKYIIGLGVENKNLIYTSHQLNKIPLGEDIYKYLRSNINNKNILAIILLSDDYFESIACLSEMGGIWVTDIEYINVYLPDFNFQNPKYTQSPIDIKKMGIDLGNNKCCIDLIELKDKIINKFNLENDEIKTNSLINEFLETIK